MMKVIAKMKMKMMKMMNRKKTQPQNDDKIDESSLF